MKAKRFSEEQIIGVLMEAEAGPTPNFAHIGLCHYLFIRSYLHRVGGGGRNRTGVDGFAGRCMTTLPPRQVVGYSSHRSGDRKHKRKGKAGALPEQKLERERSLELPTSTLAR